MALLFKRKTSVEKLETELAALRARAKTLGSRHAAAEAAFVDAKAKLQRHLLEADLDADEKVGVKLEAAVAACAQKRDNFADALGEARKMISAVEANLAAERTAIERAAAADKLAQQVAAVEATLPKFMSAGGALTDALSAISFHYETGEMARFLGNTMAQLEIAAGFSLAELRATVDRIKTGDAAIPRVEPQPAPLTVIEQPPPTQTVFMLRSANYRDHDGRKRFAGQHEDAIMPVPIAQRALRHGVAVSVADPRRAQLRGARGGDFNPLAPDVVDLDALEEPKGVPYLGVDIADPALRAANFTVIDRGPARALKVTP